MNQNYLLPLIEEKNGLALDHWEALALALARCNQTHVDMAYQCLLKNVNDLEQKKNEILAQTDQIKAVGPPANRSIPFLCAGGAAALLGLAIVFLANDLVFSGLLFVGGAAAFAVGWTKRVRWKKALDGWNHEISRLEDLVAEIEKQQEDSKATVPPLHCARVTLNESLFALVSIDDQRFLLDVRKKVPADQGKKILNLSKETGSKLDQIIAKTETMEKGLPTLLRLDGKDNPQNLEKPWGEERAICEIAENLGQLLRTTALVPLEYAEADQSHFDLLFQSQAFCRTESSASSRGWTVPSGLEGVMEAAAQAAQIRQRHGSSVRQFLLKQADRVQELFFHFGTHRKEALESIICRQVESIMQVFPDKNRVFLNPELNIPPILLPEELLEDKADWLRSEPYERSKDSVKITDIVRQTRTLQDLVGRACLTLQNEVTEGRKTLTDEARKAISDELEERRSRVLRLIRQPDAEGDPDTQIKSQNLSAVYRINVSESPSGVSSPLVSAGETLFQKIEALKKNWIWECSLTRQRETIQDLRQPGASSMGKINFTLLRDMWDAFWSSRRQEKLRIIRDKEAELRANLNEEAKDLREEARIFTEEIRHFRDMINEEVRSTEKSQSGCRRLLQQLRELGIMKDEETRPLENLLDSKDSQLFFNTSDELERCLEGEIRVAPARRQQVLSGIPVDSEILKLDGVVASTPALVSCSPSEVQSL